MQDVQVDSLLHAHSQALPTECIHIYTRLWVQHRESANYSPVSNHLHHRSRLSFISSIAQATGDLDESPWTDMVWRLLEMDGASMYGAERWRGKLNLGAARIQPLLGPLASLGRASHVGEADGFQQFGDLF